MKILIQLWFWWLLLFSSWLFKAGLLNFDNRLISTNFYNQQHPSNDFFTALMYPKNWTKWTDWKDLNLAVNDLITKLTNQFLQSQHAILDWYTTSLYLWWAVNYSNSRCQSLNHYHKFQSFLGLPLLDNLHDHLLPLPPPPPFLASWFCSTFMLILVCFVLFF